MAVNNITKLARLDEQIADLRDKLNVRLDERQTIIEALAEEGEAIRHTINGNRVTAKANDSALLSQATNLVQTGRLFTDAQIRDIRRRRANGESQPSIGKRYGVSQPTIHRIVYGLSYSDVS